MRERGRYALGTDDDDARTTTQSGEERAGGTEFRGTESDVPVVGAATARGGETGSVVEEFDSQGVRERRRADAARDDGARVGV